MKSISVTAALTFLAACFQPTSDVALLPADASTASSCPAPWQGGCGSDSCTTMSLFACVTAGDDAHASCLGSKGATCQSDCECLSGSCQQEFHADCFPGTVCGTAPTVCFGSAHGGPCLSNDDCAYGECRGGSAHKPGSCCTGQSGQCHSDSECCTGMICATDNTGCRVGPTPTCLIDGVTVASGTANPSNDCQYCDPYTLPTAWRNLGEPGAYHPPCGTGAHTGGIGPGLNYCCSGVCTDSCAN